MGREYFKCFHSYREKCKKLSDQELGRLFRALMEYSEFGTAPDLTGRESIAFDFIADEIARDGARYNEICKVNAANGAKRTVANGSERQRTVANGSERQRDEAKPSEIDKVEGIRNKDLKETLPIGSAKKTGRAVFTPPTEEEVKAYCLERKNSVDAQRFVDFYASKGWKVGNQPMKDWRAAVRTWERDMDETGTIRARSRNTLLNYDEKGRSNAPLEEITLDLAEL